MSCKKFATSQFIKPFTAGEGILSNHIYDICTYNNIEPKILGILSNSYDRRSSNQTTHRFNRRGNRHTIPLKRGDLLKN